MPDSKTIHGTCLALGEAGVLLLGVPGTGKSDLALRMIDQPGHGIAGLPRIAELVADDQVVVTRDGNQLLASAPASLAGLLEIRGMGLVRLPQRPKVRLCLAVDLAPSSLIERLPDLEKDRHNMLGVALPRITIDPNSASAPARIRAALDWLGLD